MTTCKRCVMNDESDQYITFDENGICNYCSEALTIMKNRYLPNSEGQKRLTMLIARLKKEGKGKDFDCLMGLSGGLDSSYLAYLGSAKWGLRIAAVHIDDGYDTEISKNNIKKLVERTNVHLITIKPDAEQFNALTLAYMKAGVPNLAVPQDNILFAFIYDFAKQNKISSFLSGGNLSLESILQRGNTWNAYDVVNIKDIHRRFGDRPINKLKFKSSLSKLADQYLLGLKTYMPLNFVDYRRDKAFKELYDYCGFEYYGRKHLENHLTAFIQLCWFPEKFNVDKRTSHLSSMIVSDQITREAALKELGDPLCSIEYMNDVKNRICDNLHITRDELESYIYSVGHQHDEYRTEKIFPFLLSLSRRIRG